LLLVFVIDFIYILYKFLVIFVFFFFLFFLLQFLVVFFSIKINKYTNGMAKIYLIINKLLILFDYCCCCCCCCCLCFKIIRMNINCLNTFIILKKRRRRLASFIYQSIYLNLSLSLFYKLKRYFINCY
jgi:hypothetical protein